MLVDGSDVMPEVRASSRRCATSSTGVHEGRITGYTGKPLHRHRQHRHRRLRPRHRHGDRGAGAISQSRRSRLHCVSNVDGVRARRRARAGRPGAHAVRRLLEDVHDAGDAHQRAARARVARRRRSARGASARHFVAVSTNAAAMDAFGIAPERRFTMWDWVGGRYSLWSAVGLVGRAGARHGPVRADARKAATTWTSTSARRRSTQNLPVLMGLIGVWNSQFPRLRFARGAALRPAAASLPGVPAAARDGIERQERDARRRGRRLRDGPVIWGEPGNNAQHSFFQLLHQGTARVALDFSRR